MLWRDLQGEDITSKEEITRNVVIRNRATVDDQDLKLVVAVVVGIAAQVGVPPGINDTQLARAERCIPPLPREGLITSQQRIGIDG